MAGHGASNKEIAKILDISVGTVKDHMKNIKRKYARIGMVKGRHYLLTEEEYEARLTKLIRLLRAQYNFMAGIAKNRKLNGSNPRSKSQEGRDGLTG